MNISTVVVFRAVNGSDGLGTGLRLPRSGRVADLTRVSGSERVYPGFVKGFKHLSNFYWPKSSKIITN